MLPAVVVAVAGLNAAVIPLGNPLTAKLTVPLKPFCPVTLIVLDPLLPWETVRLAGELARLKLWANTVTLIDAVLVRLPEVPVIVSG